MVRDDLEMCNETLGFVISFRKNEKRKKKIHLESLTCNWPCWSRQSRESLLFQECGHALLADQNVVVVGESGSGESLPKRVDGAVAQRSGRKSVSRAGHDGVEVGLVDAVSELGAVLFVTLKI